MKITDECIACATCVDACPLGAIVEAGDKYTINDECVDCKACLDSCPVNAIAD